MTDIRNTLGWRKNNLLIERYLVYHRLFETSKQQFIQLYHEENGIKPPGADKDEHFGVFDN